MADCLEDGGDALPQFGSMAPPSHNIVPPDPLSEADPWARGSDRAAGAKPNIGNWSQLPLPPEPRLRGDPREAGAAHAAAAPPKQPPGPPPRAAGVNPPTRIQEAGAAGAISVRGSDFTVHWYTGLTRGPRGVEGILIFSCTDASLLSASSDMLWTVVGLEPQDLVEKDDLASTDVRVERFLAENGIEHHAMMIEINGGRFQGVRAIGVAGNVKARRRVSKLAVVLAALESADHLGISVVVPRVLDEAFALALRRRQAVASHPPEPEERPPRGAVPPPPPRGGGGMRMLLGACEAAAAPKAHAASAAPGRPTVRGVEAAAAESGGIQPKQLLAMTAENVAAALGDGASQDTIEDPYMELRAWITGGPFPYCSKCNCWSDSAHVVSKKHVAWLQDEGHLLARNAAANAALYRDATASCRVPQLSPGRPEQASLHHEMAPPAATSEPRVMPKATCAAPPLPSPQEIWAWNLRPIHFEWAAVEGYPTSDYVDVEESHPQEKDGATEEC